MTSNYACISSLDLAWEDYKESPSRKDGISDAMERYHRASACRFIFTCGNQLKLDRIVKCTACVFFQSFYMRESMHSCDRYQYAAAALYLAAKTNDQPRSLYDVVNVYHVQKNLKRDLKVPPLDKKSSQCIHKLNMLKDAELKLSQTLEFEFDIDLPHSVFSKRILQWMKIQFPQSYKSVGRKTVILLEYSLHSVASLLYPPSCISCACVQLAALIENRKETKIHLPDLWYKQIEPTMNDDILDYLMNEILSVTEESARDGYPCQIDYTKMPETERMEWERQQQSQKPSVPTVGRKRVRAITELDGPAPSPLNYPTPSPHSRGTVVSEWTLYVGNIPTSTSEDQLKEVFSSTGLPVKSVKLMKDRGDRPNRYGFVTFLSKSDMETALIDFKTQEIGGVKITIQRAAVEERNPKRRKQNNVKLKPRQIPHNLFHYPQGPVFGRHSSQWKSLDVFIGYLPPEATQAQISKACAAAFGRVGRVRINRDPQGRSLGYGFVHFVDQQSKVKALQKGMVQILDGKSCIIKSTKNDQDVQGPFCVRITAFHDKDKPYFNRNISKQLLAKYFMHLGAISEIEMTNQSASIEFYQKQAQEMAVNCSGQMISGKGNRNIKIKVVEDWSPKPTGERSVFVPQVDQSVTKQEVFQAFISFGAIESVTMARKEDLSGKHPNGSGPRSAIITYKSRESQIKAIDSKTIILKNVSYEIKRYKDKHEIENEHKVLVLNIPKDITEAELSNAMSSSFGPIIRSTLKAKSGSAIVRFKSRDSAIKACREERLRISNYVVFIQAFETLVVGRTLHVGNLPKVASENEVQAYFESLLPENHGIQQLKIKMPCVNVIFQTQAQAETAFSAFRDKVFKGNRLDVEFHQRHNNRHNVQDDYAKTIWIAGLKNMKDLRKNIEVKCSIMGPVINVNVKKNHKKGDQNALWATVTFDHIDSAQKAVAKLNNREFFGSTWTVRPYSAYRTKSPGMGHHQNPMSPGPFGHFGMNPPPHPQFMGPPPLQHFPKGPMPGNFRSPVPPNGFQGKRKYYN